VVPHVEVGPWYFDGSLSISPNTLVEATIEILPAACSRIKAANAGISAGWSAFTKAPTRQLSKYTVALVDERMCFVN
jgi:hypothetical protein